MFSNFIKYNNFTRFMFKFMLLIIINKNNSSLHHLSLSYQLLFTPVKIQSKFGSTSLANF